MYKRKINNMNTVTVSNINNFASANHSLLYIYKIEKITIFCVSTRDYHLYFMAKLLELAIFEQITFQKFHDFIGQLEH